MIPSSLHIARVALRLRRVALFALVFGAVARPAQAQLSIDRGEMELRASGDVQARSGVLIVRNASATRVQGVVMLEDWDRAPDGANRFHTSGQLPHSCAPDLRVFPATMNLEPGESQSVRVEYTGTERATECTSLVVVEEARGAASRTSGVTINTRMGLKVYVAPTSSQPGGEVTDLTVAPMTAPGTSATLTATYRNDGTRHAMAKGRLEIRRDDNSIVTTVDLPSVYALAGAVMQSKAALPDLPAGKYILLAIYDFGGSELAAAQLEYEVKP